jgi:ribonuclease VapC
MAPAATDPDGPAVILDASALVAVLLAEPGYKRLLDRMASAAALAVGAPSLVEAAIVLTSRKGKDARPMLNEFLRDAEIDVIPFTADHFNAALDAFRRYGKGRHRAALNFGDCLAYAVARVAGLPLLFTGHDFTATDLNRA